MRIILLGPPGAGKGTHASRIEKEFGTVQVATGDMIRSAMKSKTELGKKADAYVRAGKLVPDEVVIGIVQERLSQDDVRDSFMLDGFPRTLEQAQALDAILEESGRRLDAVLYFDVEDAELIRRLSSRRVCEDCSTTYNIISMPPLEEGICDRCGGKLIQRSDDTPEVIRQRLRTYEEQTKPLVDFYEKKGILHRISSTGNLEEITRRVKAVLAGLAS